MDPFHPLVIPAAYLSFSFLAPTWAYFAEGKTLLTFNARMMHPDAPTLMLIATVGVIAGLGLPLHSRLPKTPPGSMPPVVQAGRAMLLGALLFNLYNIASGALVSRGVDQTTRTGFTSIAVLVTLLIPAGVLLLLNVNADGRRLLAPIDWVLVLAVGATGTLTGDRSDAVTIMICLLYGYTRRKYSRTALIAALVGAVTLTLAVGTYRALARGAVPNPSASRLDAVLTDLSVASYTTGITAGNVPRSHSYEAGATYLDAAIRQLPGELANWLIGPPVNTGNQTFRDLIGFTYSGQGFGYSLPAEGYLNFGVIGTFLACFTWGAFGAWAYRRCAWPASTARALAYPVLIATMPICVRSDAVGMVKGVLYPVLMIALVLWLARGPLRSRRPSVPTPARR